MKKLWPFLCILGACGAFKTAPIREHAHINWIPFNDEMKGFLKIDSESKSFPEKYPFKVLIAPTLDHRPIKFFNGYKATSWTNTHYWDGTNENLIDTDDYFEQKIPQFFNHSLLSRSLSSGLFTNISPLSSGTISPLQTPDNFKKLSNTEEAGFLLKSYITRFELHRRKLRPKDLQGDQGYVHIVKMSVIYQLVFLPAAKVVWSDEVIREVEGIGTQYGRLEGQELADLASRAIEKTIDDSLSLIHSNALNIRKSK